MFPALKLHIAFEQLKKDVLCNIVGIGAIAQVRQCDPKHDIPVIFNRLSKSLFFHNHLPVTLMVLDEALTIDTLLPNGLFQIQVGKTYQNKPVPFWQKESPSARGGRFPERAARCLSLLLHSPAQDGKHIKCFPLRAELATNLNSGRTVPGIRRARRGNVPHQKRPAPLLGSGSLEGRLTY